MRVCVGSYGEAKGLGQGHIKGQCKSSRQSRQLQSVEPRPLAARQRGGLSAFLTEKRGRSWYRVDLRDRRH